MSNLDATGSAPAGAGPLRRLFLLVVMVAAIFALGMVIGKRMQDNDPREAQAPAARP